MWADFKSVWQQVNPNSTNYNFMQEPLLAGDVLFFVPLIQTIGLGFQTDATLGFEE
jgi:hypothetical protein